MPLRFGRTKPEASRGRSEAGASPRVDVVSIHEEHADFVCLTLQRFGVRGADIEDLLQEVFVVVHRRLHTFDGSSHMRTWLFGIAMRVASDHRKLAYHRREQQSRDADDDPLERVPSSATTPEEAAVEAQRRARLVAILDSMDLEQRGLFVMFELDEVPCDEIAEMLGVPVGTVYSRLHAARKAFQAAVARADARDRTRPSTKLGATP